MKVYYSTFGCKVNQYETENIREAMELRGHIETSLPVEADVCIVNTCTVTAQADSKCRQALNRLRRESPDCVLVCAGCMTQALNLAELPECDIIVGSHNKQDIPDLIDVFLTDRRRIVKITEQAACAELREMHNSGTGDKTRAYIKIQDGCEMNCTYCIIPKARGRIRSKPLELIKREAAALIAAGHREIILTGINLCCYGRERGFNGNSRLIDAVEAVCGLGSGHRVRLSSLEPELISESDIARFAALDNFCRHFHLSLQSGCDRTLAVMKRHYSTSEYTQLCTSLRSAMPDCTITTDLMVGFPGETDEDHRTSMDFVREIGFAQAHIFPYSARPGTPAAEMEQVDGAVKKRRAEEMKHLCTQLSEKHAASLVGTIQRVLFEKERSPHYHSGHSAGYIEVRVPRSNNGTLRYQMLDVLITVTEGAVCIGRLLRSDEI